MPRGLLPYALAAVVGLCGLAYYAGDRHGRDAERARSSHVNENLNDKLHKYGFK